LPLGIKEQIPIAISLVFDGEAARLDDGVDSSGGEEGGDASSSGSYLFGECALGADL
jgi:hypothetical protein